MKMNTKLSCPHCSKEYVMPLGHAKEWYDDHVVKCAVGPASETLWDYVSWASKRISGGFRSSIKITGRVFMELRNWCGEVIHVQVAHNLVVNAGKDWVIDRIQSGSPPALMNYQAIGTGATAAAAGDTALETEVARQNDGTHSQPTSTTDRLVTTFGAGVGTGAITETGRLNAGAGGTLLARQVFSVVNKGAGDSLQVTHDITVS
jgi:hypothetical protein